MRPLLCSKAIEAQMVSSNQYQLRVLDDRQPIITLHATQSIYVPHLIVSRVASEKTLDSLPTLSQS
jgi:hypothetical protein